MSLYVQVVYTLGKPVFMVMTLPLVVTLGVSCHSTQGWFSFECWSLCYHGLTLSHS